MSFSNQIEQELRRTAPAPGALPDVSEAAAAAGLLDVAYATVDSPAGTLLVACTPRGLVRLAYLGSEDEDEVLGQLAAKVSPRVLASPRRLDDPRRELDQYFAGRRRQFELPLDWRLTHGFSRRVLEATARIP
jgi:methylated-DNA-[protein]-cysteine S-methyltransferase